MLGPKKALMESGPAVIYEFICFLFETGSYPVAQAVLTHSAYSPGWPQTHRDPHVNYHTWHPHLFKWFLIPGNIGERPEPPQHAER